MSGRRLLLLRHGRTAWNVLGRMQGFADVGLDDTGHAQAAEAAAYLASLRPAALWSSDLARAVQTCGHLERETGRSAKYDARLREFDVGVRQGLTVEEFAARFPAEHAAWSRGEDTPRVAGSEGHREVERRMVAVLREVLDALGPGDTGVVVAHGACLKVGVFGLLGWPPATTLTVRGMDNCAWATLAEREADGRLRLAGYNERVRPGHADFASGHPVG